MMKIEQIIEVLQAFKNGKEIQFLGSNDEWHHSRIVKYDDLLYNISDGDEYRVKPELKKVPWTMEDVPLPLPTIRNCTFKYLKQITYVADRLVECNKENLTYNELMNNHEFWTGTEWKGCYKEI